jgi:hypothetical protein
MEGKEPKLPAVRSIAWLDGSRHGWLRRSLASYVTDYSLFGFDERFHSKRRGSQFNDRFSYVTRLARVDSDEIPSGLILSGQDLHISNVSHDVAALNPPISPTFCPSVILAAHRNKECVIGLVGNCIHRIDGTIEVPRSDELLLSRTRGLASRDPDQEGNKNTLHHLTRTR